MGVRENLSYEINPGGTILFAVTLATLTLALAVFALRIYVKIGMNRQMTIDDWWMTAAVIQFIPYMIICAYGPSVGGTGRWTSDLPPDAIETALWTWAMCEVMYPPISFCVRMSIAWFLLRLAVVKWHKRVIMGVMVGNLLLSIAYLVPMAAQCVPLSHFWTQHKGSKGYCLDRRVVPVATIVHAVIGAVMDWVMALLPVAILWNVRINRRTKIGISTMLGMGVFCGISLLLRIPFLKVIDISADFLHATTGIATVAVVEPGVGIIVGSIATLQPILKRFKFGLLSNSVSGRNKHSRNRRRGGDASGGESNISGGAGASSGKNHGPSTGGGGGGDSGSRGGKTPTVLTWEERRYSSHLGAGSSGRHQHRGYSIQLSTLFSSTPGTTVAGSRLGEHSGSEESLRREDIMAQQQRQQQEQQQQQQRQQEDDEVSRPSGAATESSGGTASGHNNGFAEWQVEVSASPRGHGDEEGGRLGNGAASGDRELRTSGIAVQRDIKVVSMRVDEALSSR
ncbi:hypothetical protein Micbo1qcDRAFT_208214 [Microdochium bolleyi]|uniref:Rhodopsin domain-containing protein n=1 Tax=Microdochium bolleyi TaxID=196109 RepID=A0A136IRP9_9PEZI|nr:hypothetical protein Micbo1qcDRAFT_208214 [Microdochium bolleyi]